MSVIELEIKLPLDIHRRLKRRAEGEGRSLDQVIVAAVERWLTEDKKAKPVAEYEKTLQVIRDSGLWEPTGSDWNNYIDGVPDMTAEEIREALRGIPPVSEVIIAERGER